MARFPVRPIRARSTQEKHQRREEILRAAERVWSEVPYAELNMNQIAREAKLAKGTLYLYFDTKEALFLALLSQQLHAWFAYLLDLLRTHQPQTTEQVTAVLVNAVEHHEPLRRLLLLLSHLFEQHDGEEVRQLRRDLRRLVTEVSDHLPYAPQLTLDILMNVYALSIGWQQVCYEQQANSASIDWVGFRCHGFRDGFSVALGAVIKRLAG